MVPETQTGSHKKLAEEEELRNLHVPTAALRNHRNHREMEIRKHRREVFLWAAYGLLEEKHMVRMVVHRKARAVIRTEQSTVMRLRIRTVEEDCCRMIRKVVEAVVDFRRNRNLGPMEDNQTW